jgi:hypothetical protein
MFNCPLTCPEVREEHRKGSTYVGVTVNGKTVRLVLILLITRPEALLHEGRVVEEVGRSGMEYLELGYDLLFAVSSAQRRLTAAEDGGEMYLDVSLKGVVLALPFSLPDSDAHVGHIGRELSLAGGKEVGILPNVDSEGSGGEAEDGESEALGDGCELHVDGCQV